MCVDKNLPKWRICVPERLLQRLKCGDGFVRMGMYGKIADKWLDGRRYFVACRGKCCE